MNDKYKMEYESSSTLPFINALRIKSASQAWLPVFSKKMAMLPFNIATNNNKKTLYEFLNNYI